ncbi:lipopolysaccharide biosynthesis protein [Ligilactobacillus pobuzihii]|uniref:MOP superfamily multidrug oligosaccharidyl-lipid polysaccharide flippase transporter n=1 Tax=Ligilactobacillus pobuzihii TaxID=449659 RepID=A0A0R2LHT7_9LACO|nr:polysaccharide biosynthesis C-terminal domain-containing protein [Ligilactobacillus pobuzihii]KRK09308.1 MOP superfamily multidrug oligosaccharidyl-lipid polysaccharide flippase transporter [Ligilactobacillus pobuzihii E100301 = KCTC 13174]KRO01320.1 MOP superfamily multidrug oligosaccharidyl-lipid polysaccharide flippase transporter [Ligilactobacillus pobuzihii]GEN49053.1 hypothetical protein LPO01_18450 [Ligilactobacillus pobuzihii]
MNRYHKLIGNSVIFAIGNFGSKMMQFIMVPIYSYTLSSSQFGKTDFLTTFVTLIAPIVCLDMYDAVFRFSLDSNEDKEKIFSTGLIFTLLASIISIILGFLLEPLIHGYPVKLTGLLLVFTMLYSLMSNYVRAVGHVKKFAVAGIINTFVMGILNIFLLVVLKQGISGYLISMIIALFVAILYISISTNIYSHFSFNKWNTIKFKEMIRYSVPLIPNTLAWWLNSTSDRFFIIMFLGSGANGIYAMSSKIPNMLSTLTNIFFQSWQMSAVEEYKSRDSRQFITNVFEYFLSFIFFVSFALITVIRPLFDIILSDQYYVGWKLTPLILLTVIYSSLSGFLGTMYTASKRTGPIFITTLVGAIVNVILSVFLIPKVGTYGAAISNIISFLIVTLIRLKDIYQQDKIDPNFLKIMLLHLVYAIFSVLLFVITNDLVFLTVGILVLIGQIIFDKKIRNIVTNLFSKIKLNKRGK